MVIAGVNWESANSSISSLYGMEAPWLPRSGEFFLFSLFILKKEVSSIVIYCGVNCRSTLTFSSELVCGGSVVTVKSSISSSVEGSVPIVVEITDGELPIYLNEMEI